MSATTVGAYRPTTISAAPKAKAISCTLAVALLLGATRWGSYIGSPPLFLTDVLVAGALVARIAGPRPSDEATPVRGGYRSSAPALISILLAYVVVRMLLSSGYLLTQTWLRDGAPYLYIVLALLSGASVARATPQSTARTMKWIWRALIFHLCWLILAGLVGPSSTVFSTPRTLLSGGVFYARPDIDSAILGITAGLLLRRVLLNQRRPLALLGLLATGFAISSFVTRAGFIAVGLCLFAAFAYVFVATGRRSYRRFGLLLLVPVAVFGIVAGLSSTTVGARLLATVDPSSATQAASQNALGTETARKLTWSGVTHWTLSERSRATFGAGMGVDFLAESHTLQYLEGTDYENVRSPHDYFIGSMARLGLVGVGLLLLVVLRLAGRMVRFRKEIAEDELLVMCALAVVAIVAVATLGVVLEAPFGAVPFWWATGILFALTRVKPAAA